MTEHPSTTTFVREESVPNWQELVSQDERQILSSVCFLLMLGDLSPGALIPLIGDSFSLPALEVGDPTVCS